jgi:hypothetical protein
MPRFLNALCLTVLASFLWSANVPGQFDTVYYLNEVPKFWVNVQNDFLGVSDNPLDNNRTYSFNVGFKVDEFVTMIDYSSLTKFKSVKHEDGTSIGVIGPRVDELTLSFGREYIVDKFLFVPTIGIRFKDDLGGETIQEGWHSIANNNSKQKIMSDYESDTCVMLVGFSTRRDYKANDTFGISNRFVASITTGGELQAAVQAIGTMNIGNKSNIWAGLRYDVREGDTGTVTGNRVAEVERGSSLVFGLMFGEINLSFWNSLEDSKYNSGSIGFRNKF